MPPVVNVHTQLHRQDTRSSTLTPHQRLPHHRGMDRRRFLMEWGGATHPYPPRPGERDLRSEASLQEELMAWTRRDVLALGTLGLASSALPSTRALAQSPKRGGTLTIRGWDPPMFDPMLTTAYRVQIPLSFTHSRLVRHKAGPSVVPGTFPIEGDLAESWTQPNETTYVFKLRRGARWHPKPPVNGRELTSGDVKYTIERFLTVKGNPSAYMLRAIDRVETPDALTVRIVLKEPNASFVEMLANPMTVAIVAREAVEKFGDLKNAESVIGTGPWMLESYRPNVGLTFVRHPHYFQQGQPYIDRVEMFIDEDNASRMSAFLAGKYDLGWGFPARSAGRTGCRSRTSSSSGAPTSGRRSSCRTSRPTSRCVPTRSRSTTCASARRSRLRSTGRASSTRSWKASASSIRPCPPRSRSGR